MRTILYFDMIRKRKKWIKHTLLPVVILMVLFIASMLLQKKWPEFNYTYMKWPDMLKNLLCLSGWSMKLWLNVWHLFALFYPFYLFYVIMADLGISVVEENRLETVVYIQNSSISKTAFLMAKWLASVGEALCLIITMLLTNVLTFAAVQAYDQIEMLLRYFGFLLILCAFYLAIALFLASYKKNEAACCDSSMALLIIPLLIARLPVFLQFFSALFKVTGRDGKIAQQLALMGDKWAFLKVLSPATWCWPNMEIPKSYLVVIGGLWLLMMIMSFSIYKTRPVLSE